MSINITEAVQQKWGCLPLQKIDPNTLEPLQTLDSITIAEPLEQSSIIIVLAGLFKELKRNPTLNWGITSTNYLDFIFGEDKHSVVTAVANYAHVDTNKAIAGLEKASVITHQILNEQFKDTPTEGIHEYIISQRNNILPYLPPALQSGQLLNDSTIDDDTNKMQGPISGLMHFFEKVFSDNK